MARRYTRDNRGRFASVGATARGGRLATASGKKRETQTREIAGGKPAGTIGKNRTAKPAAKPAAARRKPVGKIDDAKASRIVSRIDANRPGQRRASASTRRDMNSLRTHERATQFLLAPSARMRKRGAQISVNESVKRAVANAFKKRK